MLWLSCSQPVINCTAGREEEEGEAVRDKGQHSSIAGARPLSSHEVCMWERLGVCEVVGVICNSCVCVCVLLFHIYRIGISKNTKERYRDKVRVHSEYAE